MIAPALVCFLVLGLWCTGSADTTGSLSALSASFPGAPYICSKDFLPFRSPIAAVKEADRSGWEKTGVAGGFPLFSPTDGLSFEAGPLSGGNRLFLQKVSLHILNSVLIL
jgi:hypothetical protein